MINTVCTNCDAQLKAPESVEGKRVKCKKCGNVFVARRLDDDFLDPDDDKPVKSPVKTPAVKSKTNSRRDDDEEDPPPRKSKRKATGSDQEESGSKPRSKKKNKGQSPKTPVLLFALIGIGALVVLGGGAVGAYLMFFNKDDPSPNNGGSSSGGGTGGSQSKASIPAGWIEHVDSDGKYRVGMPKRPQSETNRLNVDGQPQSVKLYTALALPEVFFSAAVRIPAKQANNGEQFLDSFFSEHSSLLASGNVRSQKAIKYGNNVGREIVVNHQSNSGAPYIVRLILAKDRVFVLAVLTDNEAGQTKAAEPFFNSLTIE